MNKQTNYPTTRARPNHSADKAIKTKPASIRLPQYIIDFMAARAESKAIIVERAIVETYALKRPNNARPYD